MDRRYIQNVDVIFENGETAKYEDGKISAAGFECIIVVGKIRTFTLWPWHRIHMLVYSEDVS